MKAIIYLLMLAITIPQSMANPRAKQRAQQRAQEAAATRTVVPGNQYSNDNIQQKREEQRGTQVKDFMTDKCPSGTVYKMGQGCQCASPTQEIVSGACVSKCTTGMARDHAGGCSCTNPNQEQYNGKCVNKCSSNQTRNDYGICENSACTPSAPNEYIKTDKTCAKCTGEMVLNSAQSGCVACPAGKIPKDDNSGCKDDLGGGTSICTKTQAIIEGKCVACPPGSFRNLNNPTTCVCLQTFGNREDQIIVKPGHLCINPNLDGGTDGGTDGSICIPTKTCDAKKIETCIGVFAGIDSCGKNCGNGVKTCTVSAAETGCKITGGTWAGFTCSCPNSKPWNGTKNKCEAPSATTGSSGGGSDLLDKEILKVKEE